MEIDGDFEGEIKIDPIKFSKILRRKVARNNKTSGKIHIPSEYVDEEVVILLPTVRREND